MKKGILLAGGNGTRLYPLTGAINKHLLSIYDKPMIFYSLSTLLLANVRDILIITNASDILLFKKLLGNGNELGIEINYAIQEKPEGVGQSILVAEDFIADESIILLLGDNIFHGNNLINQLTQLTSKKYGAKVLAYPVSDPERYGVVEFNDKGKVINIEEKPVNPKSKYALTGLYFYDNSVIEKAKKVKKSPRGEYEITDINKQYLISGALEVITLGRGTAWLDTGTFDSLQDASNYIKTLQSRQGLIIGCPEEIAWRKGWIDSNQLDKLAQKYKKSNYGRYLFSILKN